MKVRKVPVRQCIGCGEARNKKELLRVIKTPEDEVRIDQTGKMNGRGAYICNSKECLRTARKTKALERSLKVSIPNDIYMEMERQMNEANAE